MNQSPGAGIARRGAGRLRLLWAVGDLLHGRSWQGLLHLNLFFSNTANASLIFYFFFLTWVCQ